MPLILAERRRRPAGLRAAARRTVAAVIPVFASRPRRRRRRGDASATWTSSSSSTTGPRREIAAPLAPLAADERVQPARPSPTTAARAPRSPPGSTTAPERVGARRDRRPRLRRPARPRADPRLRRGGARRRRRHRLAARPARRCRAQRRARQPPREPRAARHRAQLGPGHPERHAPVPHRRAARRPVSRRAATRRRAGTCARCSPSGRRVASVDIPTIYDGEPSGFRPLADTLAVVRALVAAREHAPRAAGAAAGARSRRVLRDWPPRLAAGRRRRSRSALALPRSSRSTTGRSSRSTSSATGRSGSIRRSTRTRATTPCSSLIAVARERSPDAPAPLRARRRARGRPRRVPGGSGARGREGVHRPAAPRGGPRRPGAPLTRARRGRTSPPTPRAT